MEISKAYYTIFKYDAQVDLQVLVKLLEEFNVIKVDNLPKMLLLHFMLLKCMHICLHVCMYVHMSICVCVGKKKVKDPLELQFHVVLFYLAWVVGTEFRTLEHLSISLAPK